MKRNRRQAKTGAAVAPSNPLWASVVVVVVKAFRVSVAVAVPFRVTDPAEAEQVKEDGAAHVSITGPLKPLTEVRPMVAVPVEPDAMARTGLCVWMLKSALLLVTVVSSGLLEGR
jgi:hypothetical protein